ncbi:MAG TPA: TonB-dependent receptor, partial [Aromatoleum sp.]|uniref:TonB-dependent receptor plug domain-containing protein n=1 Tax=Aromatoleum sp. TaxID=2307007 RepID=UPI002B464701
FPTEMQVLIDGRSVITPSAFGGVDWSALPLTLDEIDRIEVVRGTNASGFGANAFLGVINIITRHSSEDQGTRVTVSAGDDRLADAEAHWSGGSGPLTVRVNAASQHDQGFRSLHDTLNRNTLALRGDLQVSPQDAVLLRAAASEARRGEGYADSVFGNNAPRTTESGDHTLHLQWQHTPDADSEWLVNYYRNHERIRDEWFASAPPFFPRVPLDRNRSSMRDDIEVQHRLAPRSDLQFVWGAEARRDEVDAPFLFYGGNPDPQNLFRLFGNVEWRARETLSFNAGGAQEKYSGAPSTFSPRLFANWQASPTDTLRAGYARAYRQQIPFELFGDIRAIDPASGAALVRPFLPNPDLDQTRIDSVELGYLGRFPSLHTTLDVRLFSERIRDFIVRVPQPDPTPAPLLSSFLGSTRYENVDSPVMMRGLEYQLVAQPRAGTELRLTHTLLAPRSHDSAIEDRSASYTASMSWLQDWAPGWKSMVSVLRMGSLAGGDGYVPRFRYLSRPYTTVDANLSYTTRIAGHGVQFALTALNLGPRHQEIADRTEQAASGGTEAVNRASRIVYGTATIGFD